MKEWMGLRRRDERKWDIQRSFKWKKNEQGELREIFILVKKITGKDFSDSNIYCGTVALLEGLF